MSTEPGAADGICVPPDCPPKIDLVFDGDAFTDGDGNEVDADAIAQLAAVNQTSEDEARRAVDEALEADPDEPEVDDSFRGIAAFVANAFSTGAMWAGWNPEGRPMFGDAPRPDDNTIEFVEIGDPDLMLISGVCTAYLVGEATAMTEPDPGPGPLDRLILPPGTDFAPAGANRSQRRQARRGRR